MSQVMKTTVIVHSYDEGEDSFDCTLKYGMVEKQETFKAEDLATLAGFFDEPSEFVGKTFTF